MKHKWKQTSGMNYQCQKCKTLDGVGVDWCDSDGIEREMNRIASRNDCPGKRRKRKKKPKLLFKRQELIIVTEDHGGYEAGMCVLCGSSGWIDNIEHRAGCLLADPEVKEVQLVGIKETDKATAETLEIARIKTKDRK